MADDDYTVAVPAGFRHDGATGAKLLFQRDGIHRAAALIHDYLYEKKGSLSGRTLTRKQVDGLFRRMLKIYGVKAWHVTAAYLAVRTAGWMYWRR